MERILKKNIFLSQIIFTGGAKIQVIKEKLSSEGFLKPRTYIITKNPYFATGFMDLLVQSYNNTFVREYMDSEFRYLYQRLQ